MYVKQTAEKILDAHKRMESAWERYCNARSDVESAKNRAITAREEFAKAREFWKSTVQACTPRDDIKEDGLR